MRINLHQTTVRWARNWAVRMGLLLLLCCTFAATASAQAQREPLPSRAPAAIYEVNTTADTGDGACNDGSCSLRDAITLANASPDADEIHFAIGPLVSDSRPVQTITLLTALPAIVAPVTMDGTTQACGLSAPCIAIQGTRLVSGTLLVEGLDVRAGNTTLRGLALGYLDTHAIHLRQNGGNVIEDNYIGVDTSGAFTTVVGTGVWIEGVGNNVVRNNVIAGVLAGSAGSTPAGIKLQGSGAMSNTIQGNHVGVNPAGSLRLGNASPGVRLLYGAHGNVIGGSGADEGNVVSGNDGDGVLMESNDTTGNRLIGNIIGANADGTAAIPNGESGVDIFLAPANFVGGAQQGEGNLIAGNLGDGVLVRGLFAGVGANSNQILGNHIGVSADGAAALGNGGAGVRVSEVYTTTVGGVRTGAGCDGACNLISANAAGVILDSFAHATSIIGNYIGGDGTGTGAGLGNRGDGILLDAGVTNSQIGGAVGVTLGGPCTGACNLVRNNGAAGIRIGVNTVTTSGNIVQSNFIGMDVTGMQASGNGTDGVLLDGVGNLVGGAAPEMRNVIAGNGILNPTRGSGVRITVSVTTTAANRVQGNFIGLDTTGQNAVSNLPDGVRIEAGSAGNLIGGREPGAGNIIGGNTGAGIALKVAGAGNEVLGNWVGLAAGGAALGNGGPGVAVIDTSQTVVGSTAGVTPSGACTGACNVISGNGGPGVWVVRDTSPLSVGPNDVVGNFIGVDPAGVAPLGNGGAGIAVYSTTQTIIGGAAPGAGNVVGGNDGPGIWLLGAFTATVQGNYVGVNTTGSTAIANQAEGIRIDGAIATQVGGVAGATPAAPCQGPCNLVAGNDLDGIALLNGATAAAVQGLSLIHI